MKPHDTSTPGIHRRTIVRGIGWTAPAVLAGSAVPAFATSQYTYAVSGFSYLWRVTAGLDGSGACTAQSRTVWGIWAEYTGNLDAGDTGFYIGANDATALTHSSIVTDLTIVWILPVSGITFQTPVAGGWTFTGESTSIYGDPYRAYRLTYTSPVVVQHSVTDGVYVVPGLEGTIIELPEIATDPTRYCQPEASPGAYVATAHWSAIVDGVPWTRQPPLRRIEPS